MTAHPCIIFLQMKPTRCTLLLSIFISTSLHVSGNYVPVIRKTYCTYATLVFFTLYGWLSGLYFNFSTCFGQLRAHHQENLLYLCDTGIFHSVWVAFWSVLQLLYMFRATTCPSSGKLTVSMRHWYFSLCMGDCLVCRPDSHPYRLKNTSVA